MTNSLKILFILIALPVLNISELKAQSEKVCMRVNNEKAFSVKSGNYSEFNFDLIITDGEIDTKWIKSKAETINGVVKFGVSNDIDSKTGERASYLKVESINRSKIFEEVLISIGCNKIIYKGIDYTLADFKENKLEKL